MVGSGMDRMGRLVWEGQGAERDGLHRHGGEWHGRHGQE